MAQALLLNPPKAKGRKKNFLGMRVKKGRKGKTTKYQAAKARKYLSKLMVPAGRKPKVELPRDEWMISPMGDFKKGEIPTGWQLKPKKGKKHEAYAKILAKGKRVKGWKRGKKGKSNAVKGRRTKAPRVVKPPTQEVSGKPPAMEVANPFMMANSRSKRITSRKQAVAFLGRNKIEYNKDASAAELVKLAQTEKSKMAQAKQMAKAEKPAIKKSKKGLTTKTTFPWGSSPVTKRWDFTTRSLIVPRGKRRYVHGPEIAKIEEKISTGKRLTPAEKEIVDDWTLGNPRNKPSKRGKRSMKSKRGKYSMKSKGKARRKASRRRKPNSGSLAFPVSGMYALANRPKRRNARRSRRNLGEFALANRPRRSKKFMGLRMNPGQFRNFMSNYVTPGVFGLLGLNAAGYTMNMAQNAVPAKMQNNVYANAGAKFAAGTATAFAGGWLFRKASSLTKGKISENTASKMSVGFVIGAMLNAVRSLLNTIPMTKTYAKAAGLGDDYSGEDDPSEISDVGQEEDRSMNILVSEGSQVGDDTSEIADVGQDEIPDLSQMQDYVDVSDVYSEGAPVNDYVVSDYVESGVADTADASGTLQDFIEMDGYDESGAAFSDYIET